jgi:hypothetical protein
MTLTAVAAVPASALNGSYSTPVGSTVPWGTLAAVWFGGAVTGVSATYTVTWESRSDGGPLTVTGSHTLATPGPCLPDPVVSFTSRCYQGDVVIHVTNGDAATDLRRVGGHAHLTILGAYGYVQDSIAVQNYTEGDIYVPASASSDVRVLHDGVEIGRYAYTPPGPGCVGWVGGGGGGTGGGGGGGTGGGGQPSGAPSVSANPSAAPTTAGATATESASAGASAAPLVLTSKQGGAGGLILTLGFGLAGAIAGAVVAFLLWQRRRAAAPPAGTR